MFYVVLNLRFCFNTTDRKKNVHRKETETDKNVSVIEKIEESDFPAKLRSVRIDDFEVEDLVRELRDGVTNVAEQQVATVKSVRFVSPHFKKHF